LDPLEDQDAYQTAWNNTLAKYEEQSQAEHTASHIRRHRHGPLTASQGDNSGFRLMVLGVQHLVRNTGTLELFGKQLRLGHRRSADKDRLARLVTLNNIGDNGVELPCRITSACTTSSPA
jgi:hypothetical protein